MKVKTFKEIDAVWCIAETDKGEQHMTIEEAKSLLAKPAKKEKKSVTKKTRD